MPTRIGLAIAMVLYAACAVVRADLHETFESVEPSWQVSMREGAVDVVEHRRVFGVAHSGQGAEYLRFRVNDGATPQFEYAVLPTRVIDELTISVWVRSPRPGVQLMAGIVLPRTVDERTGRPQVVWVSGPHYERSSQWQQLVLSQLRTRLEERIVALRAQRQGRFDVSEAYVDRIALRMTGGAPNHELWIDDLEIRGQVLREVSMAAPVADRAARSPQGSATGRPVPAKRSAAAARFRGDLLYIGDKPVSLRIIEYRGESLELLKRLGFNTVYFARLPTLAEDRLLASLGMWWIAPLPPGSVSTPYQRRLAWQWPVPLTVADAQAVRKRVKELRRTAGEELLFGNVESGVANYCHWLDALVLYRPTLASTSPLGTYVRWLRQVRSLARMDTPMIAAFDTDLPASIEQQIVAMGGEEISLLYSPDALEAAVWTAAQEGVRSFWFRSRRSLESPDVRTVRRARLLRRLNARLELLAPWLAAGKRLGVADANLASVHGVLWQTDYARFLLAVHRPPGIMGCPPPLGREPITLSLDGIPATDEAFFVRPQRLERLATRQASSLRIVQSEPELVTMALVTRDPRAIRYVADRLHAEADARLLERRDAIRREWDWTRVTLERLQSVLPSPILDAPRRLADVERDYRHLEQLVRARDDLESYRVAARIADTLRGIQREQWELAIRGMDHPATSPASMTFYALPVHWRSVRRVWAARWSANLLAAGDFESLAHMRESGWRYRATLDPRVTPQVAVVPAPVFSGRGSLQLSAAARVPEAATRDAPAIRIESPAVPISAGQWVKISGQVRIPTPLENHVDGLRISDSLGGIAAAQTIRQTKGWEP
ncbi:MAG TPA: hypothetical protein ENJ16_05010, partial [Planctomycetaceae bacterium]|nr:hypothetical protein [Planctomycetaceae bacterium]